MIMGRSASASSRASGNPGGASARAEARRPAAGRAEGSEPGLAPASDDGEPGPAGRAAVTGLDEAESPVAGDPIRALIVDDHALFRRGLEMVLEAEPDIELVGQASDGEEAVRKAGESLPDVVLMDIRMPRSSGIEACRALKDVAPSAKIVMLTISDEEEDLFEAIRAGASGYLLKDIPLDEVAETVRAVNGGQSLINPSMAGKLLTEFAALARREDEERPQQVPAPRLTDREIQVLKLVARGMNNRDIAKELFISENTVKNHVRNILEKLQIHSRMEAVMVAVREKLIEFG
jgi:DNA-binding NarL/FixJ family response regulator